MSIADRIDAEIARLHVVIRQANRDISGLERLREVLDAVDSPDSVEHVNELLGRISGRGVTERVCFGSAACCGRVKVEVTGGPRG